MTLGEENTRRRCLSAEALARLRKTHYNATLDGLRRVHDELAIFRVLPDAPPPAFVAGQYVSLGLGYWEPRVAGVQDEPPESADSERLVKRAYSVAAPMLDAQGRLARALDDGRYELFVTLVRSSTDRPPALTPRLFALRQSDRLFVGRRPVGRYTLEGVTPDQDVFLLATGTGEAPHAAMIAELLAKGHRGRIVCATCVRLRRDLAYLAVHRQLERQFDNYRYLVLTTREPENIELGHPGYLGKQYLQALAASGKLEEQGGTALDPAHSHVYLCGNPAMIGAPEGVAAAAPPLPGGMLELLLERGYELDRPGRRGNVHFERYW